MRALPVSYHLYTCGYTYIHIHVYTHKFMIYKYTYRIYNRQHVTLDLIIPNIFIISNILKQKRISKILYITYLKSTRQALTGVAQWIEHQPVNQRVTGLIPSQGTCLGCRPGPQQGVCKRQPHIDVSLSLSTSLPLYLKIKIFKTHTHTKQVCIP